MELKGREFDSTPISRELFAEIERECATPSGLNGARDRRPGAALVCHAAHIALPPAMRWIAFSDLTATSRNLMLNQKSETKTAFREERLIHGG